MTIALKSSMRKFAIGRWVALGLGSLLLTLTAVVTQEPRAAAAYPCVYPDELPAFDGPGGFDTDRLRIDTAHADFGYGDHCLGKPHGFAVVRWSPPGGPGYRDGVRAPTTPAVQVEGTLYFDSLGLNGGGCARLRVRWWTANSFQSTYSTQVCNELPIGVATGNVNFGNFSDLIERVEVCTQTRLGISATLGTAPWSTQRCVTVRKGD